MIVTERGMEHVTTVNIIVKGTTASQRLRQSRLIIQRHVKGPNLFRKTHTPFCHVYEVESFDYMTWVTWSQLLKMCACSVQMI